MNAEPLRKGLRNGDILCSKFTNALELGTIGRLDVVVMAGYPWKHSQYLKKKKKKKKKQAGRAGRRQGKSAAVLVAGGSPLDQFIINNPDYFFEQSPEHAPDKPEQPVYHWPARKMCRLRLPFSDNQDSPPGFLRRPN